MHELDNLGNDLRRVGHRAISTAGTTDVCERRVYGIFRAISTPLLPIRMVVKRAVTSLTLAHIAGSVRCPADQRDPGATDLPDPPR